MRIEFHWVSYDLGDQTTSVMVFDTDKVIGVVVLPEKHAILVDEGTGLSPRRIDVAEFEHHIEGRDLSRVYAAVIDKMLQDLLSGESQKVIVQWVCFERWTPDPSRGTNESATGWTRKPPGSWQ